MPSEHKMVGDVYVTKTRMIGENRFIFDAYEASSYMGPHSSLMTIAGQVCGTIASRRFPEQIAALPVGEERWTACDAYRAANLREAYAAIVKAFPEASDGDRSMGQIEVSK